jgi:hypothetical protein
MRIFLIAIKNLPRPERSAARAQSKGRSMPMQNSFTSAEGWA